MKRFFAGFLLIGLLLTAGCGGKPEVPTPTEPGGVQPSQSPTATQTPAISTAPEVSETPAVSEAPEISEPPAAILDSFRRESDEKAHAFAVAYFGYTYADSPADLFTFMELRAPGLCEELPFLTSIPEENVVGGLCGELYCIVPIDPDASVTVTRLIANEYGEFQNETEIYTKNSGEPILLLCNSGEWAPDTLLTLTTGGNTVEWHPILEDTLCVSRLLDDRGDDLIRDFSPYAEFLSMEYLDLIAMDWLLPSAGNLTGTSWGGSDYTKDGRSVTYLLTFNEDTVDVRWNDGYEISGHEYNGAAWELSYSGDFAVLSIDFQGFAGVRRYNLLLSEGQDMLYTALDVSTGQADTGWEALNRYLYPVSLNAPDPMEMVGSWERFFVEADGYQEETSPGSCIIAIAGEDENSLTISYTDYIFPEFSYSDMALHITEGEIYNGCGNSLWLADVDYVGMHGTTFCITLTEDGSLLMQNYYELDGAPTVSYEWFRRMG